MIDEGLEPNGSLQQAWVEHDLRMRGGEHGNHLGNAVGRSDPEDISSQGCNGNVLGHVSQTNCQQQLPS